MNTEAETAIRATVNPARALLVESDLFFSARIVSVLERAGHTVKTVTNRAAAEAEMAGNTPDVLIINLASPVLGGADLIRHAKRLSSGLKVIAYLSHTQIPAVRDEVLAAGADRLCANSAITMRLPSILQETLSGTGAREED